MSRIGALCAGAVFCLAFGTADAAAQFSISTQLVIESGAPKVISTTTGGTGPYQFLFDCGLDGHWNGIVDTDDPTAEYTCSIGTENIRAWVWDRTLDVTDEHVVPVSTAGCGDGVLNEGEQCDDEDANSDTMPDACRTDCTLPICGDGVVDSQEACDDGVNNGTGAEFCDVQCAGNQGFCGDGIVGPGEACDDANLDNLDGCTNACRFPSCGNGMTDTDQGEACDDGNASNHDDCLNSCTVAFCGDGFVKPDEECDDGNSIEDDACTTACVKTDTGGGPRTGDDFGASGCSLQRGDARATWSALALGFGIFLMRRRRR